MAGPSTAAARCSGPIRSGSRRSATGCWSSGAPPATTSGRRPRCSTAWRRRARASSRRSGRAMAGEDVYGSPEHLAFRATVRKLVETELAPRAREFDEMGRPDKAIFRRLGELGLLGIRYDPKYGGQGLDYSYQAVFLEELALCDNSGVAMGISVQTDMATPALHHFGSEELKQKYLVPEIGRAS